MPVSYTHLDVYKRQLLSCLCVALLSVHVEKWKDHGFDRKNKGLIAVTVLGFLTQYFFLFYCILLAAVTAAGLLCGKRTRELWIYVRSMILAAVIGLAPVSYTHLLPSFVIYSFHGLVENMVLLTLAPLCPVS